MSAFLLVSSPFPGACRARASGLRGFSLGVALLLLAARPSQSQDLAAWGSNGLGQLGNGNTTQSTTAVKVPTTGNALMGKTVVQVSVGQNHSLALCSDGTIAAWGDNSSGSLGNGSTTISSTAVIVTRADTALENKNVVQVAAGAGYSLALCSDGTVVAWGSNSFGQLGNGGTANSLTAVAVTMTGTALESKKVVQIAAGNGLSLALCSDGTVVSWGNNSSGQLGNGGTTNSSTAVVVARAGTALEGKTVVQVATGTSHSLALCSDGTIASWGNNGSGQLGNGGTTNSSTAVAVLTENTALAGKVVVQIAAGNSHSLALCTDGTVAAWGFCFFGQVGNGSTAPRTNTAAQVLTEGTALAGKTVVQIAAGFYHSLALCSDGTVAAWGQNIAGQLGSDSTTNSSTAVTLTRTGTALEGKKVTDLAAGNLNNHTLVIADVTQVAAVGNAPGALIGEYRTGTRANPRDEYIEIFNTSGAPLDLKGYRVVAGLTNPGQNLYTFTGSTILPVRASLLLTGTGYSLGSTATSNGTLHNDIPTGGGIAILNPAGQIVDQAGLTGYGEGKGVSATPASGEYAYVRRVPTTGNGGSPIDTDNNANDFVLVSTSSLSAIDSPRLGAPGPQNLASGAQGNGIITSTSAFIDAPAAGRTGVRTYRRRIFNKSTTYTITGLRVRVINASAGENNGGPDIRIGGSTSRITELAIPTAPESLGFFTTRLEAPDQPNGGGFNSSLVTTTPIPAIPPGKSIDIEFTIDVRTAGTFTAFFNYEVTTTPEFVG